jgi:hypothetical protein
VTAPGGVAPRRRAWRAARVTAVTELGQPDHLVSALIMVVSQ